MAYQLQFAQLGIAERLEQLLVSAPERGEAEREEPGVEEALGAVTWFIDRAGEEGLALTAAEYLKPADVEAVAHVMPAMTSFMPMPICCSCFSWRLPHLQRRSFHTPRSRLPSICVAGGSRAAGWRWQRGGR